MYVSPPLAAGEKMCQAQFFSFDSLFPTFFCGKATSKFNSTTVTEI